MLRTTTRLRRLRRGFTLVELLVSAAICIIIMTVLATVFQIGIDTMRQMRSAGDMADQLRSATEVMRRDLASNLFMAEEGKRNNGVFLSDQQFDLGEASPIGGFFFVSSPASAFEGSDQDGLSSTGATNHVLQFTSVLPKAIHGEQTLFTATTPPAPVSVTINGKPTTAFPQTFTSSAAELTYFLAPMPNGAPAGGTTPVFNLIRRQRLVATSDDDALALIHPLIGAPDPDVMSTPPAAPGRVNTLRSLSVQANRLNAFSAIATPGRIGEDVLMSNVISFEVKLSWSGSPAVNAASVNTDFPFDNLTQLNVSSQFDTAPNPNTFSAVPQPPVRVRMIQVRLRIYDPKLQTARQATFVQNL